MACVVDIIFMDMYTVLMYLVKSFIKRLLIVSASNMKPSIQCLPTFEKNISKKFSGFFFWLIKNHIEVVRIYKSITLEGFCRKSLCLRVSIIMSEIAFSTNENYLGW